MRLARFSDGAHYVPGGELLWLNLDGRTIGVHSTPAYIDTDGMLVPGRLESPVRTELRILRYTDPYSVVPLVCEECGDSGNSDRHTWGPCEHCHGYGEEKNLHLCAFCGEVSIEVLPCEPREVLNHELLLARMHPGCAVESAVAHVRASGAAA